MNNEQLQAWMAQRFGPMAARELRRAAAGNSRQIWIAPRAGLVVRVQAGPELSPYYTLAREARIYGVLNGSAVTVPQLRAAAEDGSVIVTEMARGSTEVVALGHEARLRALRDFITKLARVHQVIMPRDGTFGRPVPADLTVAVADELDEWSAILRSGAFAPSAVLEFGLRWLRENVQAGDRVPALVQGDAGTGNFLHEDGTVTGIIDWEFAHPGDPAEDFSWVLMRGALDRLPEVRTVVQEWPGYRQAEQDGRLGYYLAMVLWKVMVIRHRHTGDFRSNVGRDLFYRLVHHRMFVEVMARNLGLPEPEPGMAPGAATSRSWLYDYGVAELKDVVIPSITDDTQRQTVAGMVRTLRYLKAMDRGAAWVADGAGTGLAEAIRDGSLRCVQAWPAVATEVLREFVLCAEALGPAKVPHLF